MGGFLCIVVFISSSFLGFSSECYEHSEALIVSDVRFRRDLCDNELHFVNLLALLESMVPLY